MKKMTGTIKIQTYEFFKKVKRCLITSYVQVDIDSSIYLSAFSWRKKTLVLEMDLSFFLNHGKQTIA